MIELRTLGHVDLATGDDGNGEALLAQPKRFALFCYLALPTPGTMHRRDTLLGAFWPEHDQEHARADLRQSLSHIRRVLGEDVLITRGTEEVGLNPDRVWCDAGVFTSAIESGQWVQAVETYRGEFLRGFHLSHDSEFERWVDGERARLRSAYATALEQAIDLAVADGDARHAVDYCERLVEQDPYNSRHAMKLMDALVAAGDPANALLYAERHVALLREELDVAAPGEFRHLVERIHARSDAEAGVDTMTAQGRQAVTAAAGPDFPVAARPGRTSTSAAGKRPVALVATLIVVVTVLGGALATWLSVRRSSGSGAGRPTVAVMPLRNLGSPEDSILAMGLTDAITTRLAGISDLAVVWTAGSQQDGPDHSSLDRVAARLGADYLLTGTVLREQPSDPRSRIRVSVQLVRGRDGLVAWAEGFDIELGGLFEVYGEIGGQVARALNVTLLEPERRALAESPTENAQAYEYYLLGNAFFEQGFPIRWELRNAVEMYEKAIEADPGFAMAYAQLSVSHGAMFWGGLDPSDERAASMKSAAEEALRLHPGLPEGHLALGFYHYWIQGDYEQALRESELARPGLADDYWYLFLRAAVERRMGRFRESAMGAAAASDLRPLAWSAAMGAGQTYRVLRQYADAHRYLDRYIASVPSRPYGYLRKALAYLEENGDVARAREVLQRGPQQLPYEVMIAEAALDYCMPGWFRLLRVLCGDCRQSIEHMQLQERVYWHYYLGKALLYDRAGDRQHGWIYYDSAAAILEELVQERPDHAHLHADLGVAYAALGRKEPALREARLAVSLASLSADAWERNGMRKLAEVYAMLGEADSAVAQLEVLLSSFAAGQESGQYINPMASVPLMRIDPVWDSIRGNPGFQALLDRYDPLR